MSIAEHQVSLTRSRTRVLQVWYFYRQRCAVEQGQLTFLLNIHGDRMHFSQQYKLCHLANHSKDLRTSFPHKKSLTIYLINHFNTINLSGRSNWFLLVLRHPVYHCTPTYLPTYLLPLNNSVAFVISDIFWGFDDKGILRQTDLIAKEFGDYHYIQISLEYQHHLE